MQQTLITPHDCPFIWVDLTNPTPQELDAVAKQYNLHESLVLDCLEPDHLPKIETIDTVTFIITRIYSPPKERKADTIQNLSSKIAIFYSSHFLITVHRLPQPDLDVIYNQEAKNGPCDSTHDLAIRIIKRGINSFIEPGLNLVTELDAHESVVFLRSKAPELLQRLYYFKRKVSSINRVLGLTEDLLNTLQRKQWDSPLLQDAWDLTRKANSIHNYLEDSVTQLLTIYMSISAQKTNEVMRILTIFSASFLPLTFLTGLYGMNFEYMPELKWKAGYPVVLGLMIAITATIYVWFRRKRWI